MNHLTLSPLGDIAVVKPSSWTALADLTMSWPITPTDPDYRLRLIRVSAAAIGMSVQDERLKVPPYRPARLDLLTYGEEIIEVLMPLGVQLSSIIRAGRELSVWLAGVLPSEEEVSDTAAFIEAEAQGI